MEHISSADLVFVTYKQQDFERQCLMTKRYGPLLLTINDRLLPIAISTISACIHLNGPSEHIGRGGGNSKKGTMQLARRA